MKTLTAFFLAIHLRKRKKQTKTKGEKRSESVTGIFKRTALEDKDDEH
jgi:hypothetical protein